MQQHSKYILGYKACIQITQLSTQSTSIPITRQAPRVQSSCYNTPTNTTVQVITYTQVSGCMCGRIQLNNTNRQNGQKNCSLFRPSCYATIRASSSDCLVVYSPTSLVVYPKTIWAFWGLSGVATNVTKGEFQSWQCEFFEPIKAPLGWTALIIDVCEETTIGKN